MGTALSRRIGRKPRINADGYDGPKAVGRGAQADEQMQMVIHAADSFRISAEIAHDAAKIGVQPFAPRGDDEWATFFRAKDDVIMEREVCGWHGCEVPAPLPGRVAFYPQSGG